MNTKSLAVYILDQLQVLLRGVRHHPGHRLYGITAPHRLYCIDNLTNTIHRQVIDCRVIVLRRESIPDIAQYVKDQLENEIWREEQRFENPHIHYIDMSEKLYETKIELLNQIITLLATGESLPDKYRDHALSGDWAGYRECHIQPDWLLVYQIYGDQLILFLARTGAHSDLF